MRIEASYSLNFLVYIQNIYLNQNCSNDEYRFPYIPSRYIAFRKGFEIQYKELWDDVARRIADHPMNDVVFAKEKDLFYQRLFVDSEKALKEYNEIYQSFKVWWGSLAGGYSIERSIDEKSHKLYVELASSLTQKGIEPQREFNISLVYDECLLGELDTDSYFAILSIKDFLIKYKELVPKLQKCIY